MATADHFPSSEIPFLKNPSEHQCPACEALGREEEAIIRKIEAAQSRADYWKKKTLEQEAERERLLRLLFPSKPQET